MRGRNEDKKHVLIFLRIRSGWRDKHVLEKDTIPWAFHCDGQKTIPRRHCFRNKFKFHLGKLFSETIIPNATNVIWIKAREMGSIRKASLQNRSKETLRVFCWKPLQRSPHSWNCLSAIDFCSKGKAVVISREAVSLHSLRNMKNMQVNWWLSLFYLCFIYAAVQYGYRKNHSAVVSARR